MICSGTPIRNGQQVNKLLTVVLSPSEIGVIKTESYTKSFEPDYRGTLADFQATAAATESVKIAAHVDDIHSASAKNDPSVPDFCHPDAFVMCQQICS